MGCSRQPGRAPHDAHRRHAPPARPATSDSATLPGTSQTGWYLVATAMAETIGWFTFSGLFEKYPDLTIVMTEGYAGWMAFAMQFFDHHWDDRWGRRVRSVGTTWSLPGYLRRRCSRSSRHRRASTWSVRQSDVHVGPLAIGNRDLTGLDCLLWGTTTRTGRDRSPILSDGWTSSSPVSPRTRSTRWFAATRPEIFGLRHDA